jgi:rare lipoprotein A
MTEFFKNFGRFMMLAVMAGSLGACSQLQLAAAEWKEYRGPPQTQGNFKVGRPYSVQGKVYRPTESYSLDETGISSWYGPGFHGARTANGEKFDENELTAAHRTLQLPSLVRVTNLENGKSVVLRVNDRGPFAHSRVIDVSKRAAELLGYKSKGTARVRVQVLDKESRMMAEAAKRGEDTRGMEIALNSQPPVQQMAMNTPMGSGYGGMVPPPDVPPPGVISASLPPDSSTVYSDSGIPGHVQNNGHFYPDPVVKQFPVIPTNLYVQAGSFSSHENALKVSSRLQGIGTVRVREINVGGRQYFRVQVGPARDVGAADALLSDVMNKGYPEARITVDSS